MSEDSEPRQLRSSTVGGELIALGLTESDGDDERSYYLQALELCHLLLSVGRSVSVLDLSSQCTNFQASPEHVKFLCSIPNSPISLAGDGCTVTLSCEFLSAPASFSGSLGVPVSVLFEQITNFMDSRSPKLKRNCLENLTEKEEEEELQLIPLPKRSRKDENDVNISVVNSSANDITTIADGSMLQVLLAFDSQASNLMLSTHSREIVGVDHKPLSGPLTQISGCETFPNPSVDVNPMPSLEESKQDSASPQKAGNEQLEIGDYEIADNQILFVDGENKNIEDVFPKGEIQTPGVQSNPASSSIPSENELISVQIVEDSEDTLHLSCNSSKPVHHSVDNFCTPVRELSAKSANQDKNLVHKSQDLCKSSGNSKAYIFSPEKKHTRKIKAIQKSKQNINTLRPKDQELDLAISPRDESKHNAFPEFDSYTILEKEGSGGYGIVYKAKRKTDGTEFAIKCPHADAQKHYVNNEIRMLERFGGKNYIIKFEGCLKNGDSDGIILEHLEHDRPDLLKREIDVHQLQLYGYCMFKALSSLHKQNIVHRDVKPGNFLFSRKPNKGYLIDFNLAMDLHQKYRRADKSKAASDLPTSSKKHHHTLVKSPDATDQVTNKSSQKTLAPNSLKRAAGKIRAQHDMSRWERFNSQGAEGSGLTSAKYVTSTRKNPTGEKRRQPLPRHGRKELLNFLQETMSGPVPNHEVSSKRPTSMRKRVTALSGKAEKQPLYLTPMPLRSNGRLEAGDVIQKKDGPCSGTKGFRAPEVCFRSLHQGPKIDVWSAGVTLLYLMMGRTPFTGDPEQNIKDIAQLRGSEELWELAKLHNRESSFPEELYEPRYLKGIELRKWCERNTKRREFLDAIPQSLLDLIDKCLTVNPRQRISAEDALKHDFFILSSDVKHGLVDTLNQ